MSVTIKYNNDTIATLSSKQKGTITKYQKLVNNIECITDSSSKALIYYNEALLVELKPLQKVTIGCKGKILGSDMIIIASDSLPRLDTPVIRLEDEDNPDSTSSAVLGVAVLGRAILGNTGSPDADLKLSTPIIRLVEDIVIEKLSTPVIRLEEDVVIEKLDTPVIKLINMKLDTPVIEIMEV